MICATYLSINLCVVFCMFNSWTCNTPPKYIVFCHTIASWVAKVPNTGCLLPTPWSNVHTHMAPGLSRGRQSFYSFYWRITSSDFDRLRSNTRAHGQSTTTMVQVTCPHELGILPDHDRITSNCEWFHWALNFLVKYVWGGVILQGNFVSISQNDILKQYRTVILLYVEPWVS